MNLNQPNQVIDARLYDSATGAPLPTDHVFADGDLKIVQPDGTVANATNLPTGVAGAAPGTFKIVVAQAQLQQPGNIRLQLSATGVDYWEWVEPVVDPASSAASLLDFATTGHTAPGSVGAAIATGGGDINLATTAVASAVVASLLPRAQSSPPTTRVPIYYNVGDLEPPLLLALPLDGVHDTIDEAASAQLRWKKPDGTVSMVDLAIADPVKRVVQRTWSAGETDVPGLHTGEVVITWADGRTSTAQTLYQWTVKAPLA